MKRINMSTDKLKHQRRVLDAIRFREFLSKEEVNEMILSRDPEKVAKVLDNHLPLLLKAAVKYAPKGDLDMILEFVQIGYYKGLVTAAEKFNPDKGVFSAYAMLWVRSAFDYHLRAQTTLVKVPFNTTRHRKTGNGTNPYKVMSLHAGADDRFDSSGQQGIHFVGSTYGPEKEEHKEIYKTLKDVLEEALDDLPERERHAVVESVIHRRILQDIAQDPEIDRSYQRTQQIKQEGLIKLRRILKEKGYASYTDFLPEKKGDYRDYFMDTHLVG
jgi:RNA polymerase sigma factor (sigma-70 family)